MKRYNMCEYANGKVLENWVYRVYKAEDVEKELAEQVDIVATAKHHLDELEKVMKENERLRKTLKFYADIDKMADIQHAIWAKWMVWMFEQGIFQSDSTWIMPQDKVERWARQMDTEYRVLSEKEQQSDRDVIIEFDICKPAQKALEE